MSRLRLAEDRGEEEEDGHGGPLREPLLDRTSKSNHLHPSSQDTSYSRVRPVLTINSQELDAVDDFKSPDGREDRCCGGEWIGRARAWFNYPVSVYQVYAATFINMFVLQVSPPPIGNGRAPRAS